MRNETTVKIPKKYQPMLDEAFHDSDGYWAYTKNGYRFDATESHTAHGYTQAEFLQDIRSLSVCDCDECKSVDKSKGL